MNNNWLRNNKSNDISCCDYEECTAVIDLRAEKEEYRKALERINARILNENADDCLLDVKDIIDEVLND